MTKLLGIIIGKAIIALKYIFVVVLTLLPLSAIAEIETIIKKVGLDKTSPVYKNSGKHSHHLALSYCVEYQEELIIIDSPQCNKNILMHSYKQLTFIGSNHGEFGGKLQLIKAKEKPEIIIEENIVHLHQFNNTLYVFTGLSHLLSDNGAIYKIDLDSDTIAAKRVTLLPSAPKVITFDSNQYYIVTSDGLMTFSPDIEVIDVLLIKQFWSNLSPSSVVKHNDTLIIGMKSGIATVRIEKFTKKTDINFYTKQ